MPSSKSNPLHKKYKAIIFDVDGTLINGRYALPSEKVTKIINKARGKIHIGLATSRPIFMLTNLIKHLKLSGPSIIDSGATIIDSTTKKILWQKNVFMDDVKKVRKISKDNSLGLILSDGKEDIQEKDYKNENVLQLWIPNIDPDLGEKVRKEISKIPTLAVYQVYSWKEGQLDLIVTHSEATKQHGIMEIAKILGINTHEIIAVGDGYNDFPLLMACGLKVAMGNAVDDLKAIADYIAPRQEEDGAADVIERFVL